MFELKKWEPFKELTGIQRDLDEFFRRAFGSLGSLTPTSIFRREFRGEWYPTLDCFMKNNQFIVRCDLPGVDPKNVEISITGNMLSIRGERKLDYDEKKEGYVVHESAYGTFERSFTLPEGVDYSNVHAVYKNGVLELTMPAKAEALPKKVKIEVEEGKETKKAA